ncbi:multicopper oxidase family protein [Clostridium hydrogeniformans]|uniref:multicopper oxidase family protein n=1 Tax=Clostridium hydrogeniformans TaxID=349933 RepID=UPI0006894A69|nr:multicopper oxidase [Clostridium hydrogeniformans]
MNNNFSKELEEENYEFYNEVDPSKPDTITKFVDDINKPRVLTPRCINSKGTYYEVEMKECYHKFHKYFPKTRVWAYEKSIPGPTIEVLRNEKIHVKWINSLPLKHFLPIDRTLHGAVDNPEVRTVVHVHGARVDSSSDGHPDAWFTRCNAITGIKFEHEVYRYTNDQQATTLWYHDHSIGITRLNVYAGLVGFYIIKDTLERKLNLPCGNYDIPLMIQDKSFNSDGSLFYPDSPPFPVRVKPSVTPFFLGNTIVVNGKVWPHLKVEPRKYRFRVVNGSNTRNYNIALSNNQSFFQIGTDGGLLNAPITLNEIPLEPAERADIVIDFSKLKGESLILKNLGDNSPHTGVLMEFQVVLPLSSEDTSKIPNILYPIKDHLEEHMATRIRTLPLTATQDDYGRPMLLLDNKMWHDPATEKPLMDSIEVWNLVNLTAFPHPIHVHLVQFKILDRRLFDEQKYLEEGILEFIGDPVPPREYERGWKDTVKADSKMVTRIIMHFKEYPGDYVWHCHILEHEDHDMMRPIRVLKE